MKDFELVQNFFSNMHCSKCQSTFDPSGIILLKEETNYFVVKITCMSCNQPVGIAIVGVNTKPKPDKPELTEETLPEIPALPSAPPISYDDVIDAHNFFNTLGPDWMSHINNLDIDVDSEPDEDDS